MSTEYIFNISRRAGLSASAELLVIYWQLINWTCELRVATNRDWAAATDAVEAVDRCRRQFYETATEGSSATARTPTSA